MSSFKKSLIIYAVVTAIAGTLAHFVYDFSGQNYYVGLFFPVSESVWEHMKLIFFPMLIISFLIHFKFYDTIPSLNFSLPAAILFGTWLIPLLYYFYSGVLGFTIMAVDITIFYIAALVSFFMIYRFSGFSLPKFLSVIFYGLVILMIALFMLNTYTNPEQGIFKKPEQKEQNISLSYSDNSNTSF